MRRARHAGAQPRARPDRESGRGTPRSRAPRAPPASAGASPPTRAGRTGPAWRATEAAAGRARTRRGGRRCQVRCSSVGERTVRPCARRISRRSGKWRRRRSRRDMHEGIAGRPFRILGPMAAPVRIAHDGISRAVHAGVRTALRALPQGGAHALALRAGDEAPPVGTRTPGALVVAALNGVYGNHLATRGNALALDMEVRRHGAPVPITPDGLAAAFPDATSRIVVFVHGLCETDEAWRLLPLRGAGPDRRPYGERLQDELGFTPIPLRYNTGLHISENGRGLARTLEALVLGWPAPVSELGLVGHSMGGLVARSACHFGEAGDHRWTAAVRHVFCLGSPHLGAELEKGANVLAWGLARLPETRGLARVLNARSVGIKDLRYGACV